MKIIPLILALGLAVGGVAVPAAPAPVDRGDISVVAAPAFAGVLRPGQALFISGTVTNSMAQAMDAGTATVYVSSSALTTRTALAHWLSDDHPSTEQLPGNPLGAINIGELAAGQSRAFSLTIAATALAPLNAPSGVFPLAVRLTSGDVTLATTRSAISWYAEGQVPLVNLAVATPLDSTPVSTGLLDAETLLRLTSPGGVLYQQLETALAHTVAIGVDPMIVASIRILGTSAPQTALDWLNRLESSPNDTFSLAYADSDQILLHHAGASVPLDPISFPIDEALFPNPETTSTPGGATPNPTVSNVPSPQEIMAVHTTIGGLAWPASERITEDDLDFLEQGGATRTLVSSTSVSGSVLTTPNVTIGKHLVTVPDEEVSSLMKAAATATTDGQWSSAVASLTATLAVTATQSPGATIVATPGRTSSPNSRMLGSTLNAIESLPWVKPTRLSTALDVPPALGSIVKTEGAGDEVLLTKELLASEQTVTAFSSVANNPALITGPQRLSILSLLSGSWFDDLSGWQAAVQAHLTVNSDTLSSVSIPESSSITLLQEKGNLPITVRNELDFPVTVFVSVRPERAILDVLNDRVELTVEANSQAKASVPVQSIANGEVRTTVSLSSGTGIAISSPTVVVLNVQAGWETAATVALTVVVIALFGAGVGRTILRRRKLHANRQAGERATS